MQIVNVEEKYNKEIEDLIRYCLIEYGGNHEGTAWADPYLGRFSEVYCGKEDAQYWVAVDDNGKVVGGVGIGPLEGVEGVCELQKMYTYPEVRGSGIAQELLNLAIEFAEKQYDYCYLETFDNMIPAQKFYAKNGFERTEKALGDTGHFSCEVKMIKKL